MKEFKLSVFIVAVGLIVSLMLVSTMAVGGTEAASPAGSEVPVAARDRSQAGLVAHYPFTGNADDASGNGNHGTVYGATLTTDRFGSANSAYSFDGTDDYIEIADSASLDIAGPITLAAWVKFHSNPGGSARIVDKSHSSCAAPWNMYALRLCCSANQFSFDVTTGSNNMLASTNTYPLDTWLHVVGTYDGSSQKFYVNGVLDNSASLSGAILTNDEPVLIGKHNACNSMHFDGVIDDVRIYDYALDESEILNLYPGEAWMAVTVSGPSTGGIHYAYDFTATTVPSVVTTPITYTWQVTDYAQVMTHTSGLTDTASFTWNNPGTKVISVTAANVASSASDSHVIEIDVPPVFLPLVARNYFYCPDFFDDFSDPASGWPVGEDGYVRYGYLNGEYRVLSKVPGYLYLFSAPTCESENYVVEVDARWDGGLGNGYGLIFGIAGDFDQYYFFDVSSMYQMFRLYRREPSGFVEIVAPQVSTAIHSGTTTNHLKTTRNGNSITLVVNGTTLGTWTDSGISGLTSVGIVASNDKDDPRDARFDNFRVTRLPDSSATTRGGSGIAGMPHRDAHREPLPVGW